jgi:hypothetical protein
MQSTVARDENIVAVLVVSIFQVITLEGSWCWLVLLLARHFPASVLMDHGLKSSYREPRVHAKFDFTKRLHDLLSSHHVRRIEPVLQSHSIVSGNQFFFFQSSYHLQNW